jgi:hypothetical protein
VSHMVWPNRTEPEASLDNGEGAHFQCMVSHRATMQTTTTSAASASSIMETTPLVWPNWTYTIDDPARCEPVNAGSVCQTAEHAPNATRLPIDAQVRRRAYLEELMRFGRTAKQKD